MLAGSSASSPGQSGLFMSFATPCGNGLSSQPRSFGAGLLGRKASAHMSPSPGWAFEGKTREWNILEMSAALPDEFALNSTPYISGAGYIMSVGLVPRPRPAESVAEMKQTQCRDRRRMDGPSFSPLGSLQWSHRLLFNAVSLPMLLTQGSQLGSRRSFIGFFVLGPYPEMLRC